MILLFMMGISFYEVIVLILPIAVVVFIKSKNLLRKKFKTESNAKVWVWSILLTAIIAPLIFIGLIALIFFSVSFYEGLN